MRLSPEGVAVAAGLLALAVGALVYLADRDPAHVMALPAFAVLATGPLFGAAADWLPSFVHAFAFSLFTAAAWPRALRPAYGACVFWWAVDLAFEAAQHPPWRAALARALPSGLDTLAPANWVARYAQQGRFDPMDVLAITAGALAAAGLLYCVHQLRETPHAC
ncbi:MAG: hypothetical protein Q7U73_21270 [Rubrivivax sp.]|nr:hypothetical protein [Rubrivivax sp.]